jgi:hypothetical protein
VSAAGIAEKRRVYAHSGASAPMSRLHLPRSAPKMRPIGRLIDNQIGLSLLEFDHIKNYKHSSIDYAAAVS